MHYQKCYSVLVSSELDVLGGFSILFFILINPCETSKEIVTIVITVFH